MNFENKLQDLIVFCETLNKLIRINLNQFVKHRSASVLLLVIFNYKYHIDQLVYAEVD